ncbi:hypothetical protein IWQ60_004409 [Tieghemiomyces parasiticus]|uniref:AB hydrolase-1 domain-containing protein n=1 Tax=Tieghemiomyces parasiticus TaxID=78921 RepID=A0A9W8AEB4_9FUNG|nr:hypothetical protein IWQ60_004409 [Tieghemiomyces parasiticus]
MDRFTITSTVFDAPQNGHKIAAKIYTPRREASDPGRGHSKLDRKPRDLADVTRQVRTSSMLVGVGHSLGASIMLTAQIVNPGLFDAIFAVEPILAPNPNFNQTFDHILKSRTVWKSERFATKHAIDHPFYATWDPRSHKVYLRYGLSPTEGPTAETQDGHTMTPAQVLKPNCHSRDEFETYVGGWNECVWAIEHLREIICPTRFLTGQLSSVCPNPRFTKAYASSCFLSDGRAAKGLGHLIVMESPETTAHQMGIFLNDILVVINGLRMRSLI